MFRATMCPSSGETTVFVRHLVLFILCGWLSGMQGGNSSLPTRQSSTQNNKYQMSHKHGCFYWWWSHSRPKHVEIDKHTKNKLCTELALFTRFFFNIYIYIYIERLRWSRGSVLAFGTQVRGFKPGRSCRMFRGEKILSTPSFGGEVKPSVPCRRFAACKRSLNFPWKSCI